VTRAAPVCWAVIPDGPGRWRKQLLLSQDPIPLNAAATAATEDGADKDIDEFRKAESEREEFLEKQGSFFISAPGGELVSAIPSPEERAAEGRAKALAAAPVAWREAVWRWISKATPGNRFTVDDVLSVCELPPGHSHAPGALMKNAAVAGLIVKTGDYVPSKRESCNGAVVAVWARTGSGS
jgi:hypothetical protein